MKIVLSGGVKTVNIRDGVAKKFQSSGDEFIVENFIDSIETIFTRGDSFDKALITEQSISKDGAIKSEEELRQRVNNFASSSANRNRKNESYVFLVQSEEMAELISDETFLIKNSSVVVLKTPPYSVNFFVTLLVNDITKIPENLVYKPSAVTSEVEEATAEVQGDPFQEAPDSQFVQQVQPQNSFDTEVAGGDLGLFDDSDLPLPVDSDEYTVQDSMNTPVMGNEMQRQVMSSNQSPMGSIPGFDTQDYDDVQEYDNQGYGTNGNMSGAGQIQSGVPGFDDYDTPVQNNVTQTGVQFMDEQQQQSIPGFDDEDYGVTQNGLRSDGQDLYNGFDGSNIGPLTSPAGSAVGLAMGTAVGAAAVAAMSNSDTNNFSEDFYDDSAAQQQNTQHQINDMGVGYNNGQNVQSQQAVNNGNHYETMQAGQGQKMPSSRLKGGLNVQKVKDALKPFAARGNSIVVTGCGGCGTSTVAHNLANMVCQLGYTALLVDMDTKGRSQSYMSRAAYENMDSDGANLMAAVNSSNGINTHFSVIRQGLHLLTMGLGADTAPVDELLHKEKISRFVNLAKSSHNFVIYDVPFDDATNFLSDLTYTADNLVVVVDTSNWGIVKAMLNICNISSEDMQDVVFKRTQLVFNKLRNLHKVMGNKIKTGVDILRVMDKQVLDLIGDDPGFHFENLKISGIINDDPNIEDCWFEEVQYSDSKRGQQVFLELLYNIVMNK